MILFDDSGCGIFGLADDKDRLFGGIQLVAQGTSIKGEGI